MQIPPAMLDWNDLRIVQAITRTGSVAGAARQLGVHQSTVFRRLNALEKELGVRLFERLPSGYIPTPAGEEFCQTAEGVEADIAALSRRISGRDMRPSGTVRVTTADIFLLKLLTPCFAAFQKAYPEIELEAIASLELFNLTKRDADVAIRTSNRPPETLVGRRIASMATAIYGSRAYLETHPNLKDLSKHHWVGYDEGFVALDSIRWLERKFPGIRFRYRVNTGMGMLEAVKAGLGLGAVPCFLAESEPDLRIVHPPIPELDKGLWILTHDDLRYVARVRTFIDFVAGAIAPDRQLLEGRKRGCELGEG